MANRDFSLTVNGIKVPFSGLSFYFILVKFLWSPRAQQLFLGWKEENLLGRGAENRLCRVKAALVQAQGLQLQSWHPHPPPAPPSTWGVDSHHCIQSAVCLSPRPPHCVLGSAGCSRTAPDQTHERCLVACGRCREPGAVVALGWSGSPISAGEADAVFPYLCLLVSALLARLGFGRGTFPKNKKGSRVLLGIHHLKLIRKWSVAKD